jgi:hypothetical protein
MSAAGIGDTTSIATGTIAFIIVGVTIATLVGVVADKIREWVWLSNRPIGRLAAELGGFGHIASTRAWESA